MFWIGFLSGAIAGMLFIGLVMANDTDDYQDGWQAGYVMAQKQFAEKEKRIKEQEEEYNKENESSDN